MIRRAYCMLAVFALTSACRAVETGPDVAAAPEVGAPEVAPQRSDAWISEVYKPVQAQACELDPAGFAALYPEPKYLDKISHRPDKAAHMAKIGAYARLTPEHRATLANQGFVAVDNADTITFATTYLDLYARHLPVLVTTDSLLFALHRSYDALLIHFESFVLRPAADRMLAAMHARLAQELASLPTTLRPAALDLDVYLAVARSLLASSPTAPVSGDAGAAASVAGILRAASWLQPASLSLFGVESTHDLSQLKPRGHYADDPDLRTYFQAMMWLGRTEMPMVTFDPARKPTFNRRGFEAAFLADHLLRASGAADDWLKIDAILSVMVGDHDGMTPTDMQKFAAATDLRTPVALARASDEQLYTTLMREAYGLQRIMSQILVTDPHSPNLALPRVFLLMGQRFTIDANILHHVTYDRIQDLRTGDKVTRMLPSELDVQFVLGNDAAARRLRPEIEKFNYQGVLHELRFLVDAHPPAFWDANLYNGWLSAIRALNDREDFDRWPEAMRTPAWADKQLNTQAASWAELRHDTLLYAKQSYSSHVMCEYPDAYVEPVPRFYARLGHIGKLGTGLLDRLKFPANDPFQAVLPQARQFFADLTTAGTTLEGIARKELAGTDLSPPERDFLRGTIEKEMVGCGDVHYDGWYGRLFYDRDKITQHEPTIADVHTAPSDEFGNPTGHVLHAATGKPMLMVFTLKDCKGVKAYIGPISSYHSVLTAGFARKSDEEWAAMLAQSPVPRPSWTASFVR